MAADVAAQTRADVAARDGGGSSTAAAARLSELLAASEGLRSGIEEARGAIAACATSARVTSTSASDAGADAAPRGDVAALKDLVAEAGALATLEKQVRALAEARALMRETESAVRAAEAAASADPPRGAAVEALEAAASSYMQADEALRHLASLPPPGRRLRDAQRSARERTDRCLARLRDASAADARRLLGDLHWPPPAVPPTDGTQPTWQGWPQGAPPSELLQALSMLVVVQAAAEPVSGTRKGSSHGDDVDGADVGGTDVDIGLDSDADPAMGRTEYAPLWAVSELVRPTVSWLKEQFEAGGLLAGLLPGDRLEMLLRLCERSMSEAAPHLAPLQPCLASDALDPPRELGLEFHCAMAAEASELLQEHCLADMLSADDPDWIRWTHDLMAFDKHVASLASITGMDEAPAGIDATYPSVMAAITSSPGCWDAFLDAAEEAAVQAARRACREPDAWQPSQLSQLQRAEDEEPPPAWRSEECPLNINDELSALINAHMDTAAWLQSLPLRTRYLQRCLGSATKHFLERCTMDAEGCDAFREPLAEPWLSKVSSRICATAVLQRRLDDVAMHPALAGAGPGDMELVEGMLAEQIAALAAFQSRWVQSKLARAVFEDFSNASARYRGQTEVFKAVSFESAPASVTPSLIAPLSELEAALGLLSGKLDRGAFRSLWRTVAKSVLQLLFNDVATEARFSHQGAAQFDADCQALFSVFQPFTPRPALHFKPLADAAALLTAQVPALESALASLQDRALDESKAMALLRERLGVQHLSRDQAELLLLQRLGSSVRRG